MNFTKDLHYSQDLEFAVIGVCMLESAALPRTYGLIQPEIFYWEANQKVYSAMSEMYRNGLPIDLLTVNDFLINRMGVNEFYGSNTAYYLTNATRHVVSSAHLEYHCFILKRMWMERELIKLTHGGIQFDGDVKEQIFQLQTAIQRINSGEYAKDWTDSSELIVDLIKHQEKMIETKGKGLSTGIRALDDHNGGFWPGQMVVIGARPSVGKSAFMGQMALSIAKQGKTVGIISLEMSNNEIAARLAALETQEDFNTIFRGLYKDEDQRAMFYQNISGFTELPIYISEKTDVNALDIRSKAAKLKVKHGLDVLMIDYLQLISSDNGKKNRTRENEVSEISRACKIMAKELGIPVVVLCQLSRAITQRKGVSRYPQLSDLRESGSIEQDADVVMFVHRDWMLGEEYMQDENGDSTENQADLIVRKWRNGTPNLHVKLGFDGARMRFIENSKNGWIPMPQVDYQDDNPF